MSIILTVNEWYCPNRRKRVSPHMKYKPLSKYVLCRRSRLYFYYLFCLILFMYSFIFSCAGFLLLSMGFFLAIMLGLLICSGFSCCGAQALECWLIICIACPQLPWGMWNLPGPGIESVSWPLAGRFLTTRPSGKSRKHTLDERY